MPSPPKQPDHARLDRIVAEARRASEARADSYRMRALAILQWVCTRCARTFDRTNVAQLTVHHRNHDHHDNPPDGSNWELLCIYCHENEHARERDNAGRTPTPGAAPEGAPATHKPFAALDALLKGKPRQNK